MSIKRFEDVYLHRKVNTFVYALIYKEDGCILVQREEAHCKSVYYRWNLPGNFIENDETPFHVLKSSLVERFGGIPGKIGEEIFTWTQSSDLTLDRHYFFPVLWKHEPNFFLKESLLRWSTLDELIELPLSPMVYENFAHIFDFLSRIYSLKLVHIENRLLSFNKLIKKNDRVFYAKKTPFSLSRQQIFLLKELASLKKVTVFRVCLHTDDKSDIHEMLMIHVTKTSVGPLKQNKTSLSYHIIDGSLIIKTHSDSGLVLEEYFLCKDNFSEETQLSLRLNAGQYRSIHTDSPWALFLEVASGPFDDSDTIWFNKEGLRAF